MYTAGFIKIVSPLKFAYFTAIKSTCSITGAFAGRAVALAIKAAAIFHPRRAKAVILPFSAGDY
jgi:hypothetical protein